MKLLQSLLANLGNFAERPALIQPFGKKVSYAELEKMANHFCHFIQQVQGKQRSKIGIWLPKTPEKVAVILGSILADKVYVPLDYVSPNQRNSFIIKDCKLEAIVLEKEKVKVLVDFPNTKTIEIPHFPDLVYVQLEWDAIPSIPDDLATIFYTSGSTGTPKGVLLSHENIHCFVEWACKTIKPDGQVILSIAPFQFDLSTFDLYAGLKSGCAIVLADHTQTKNPRLIVDMILRYEVNTIYATPTFYTLLAQHGRLAKFEFNSLKNILFAGEIFPIKQFKQLKSFWQQPDYYNLYGPTETNVCTFYKLPKVLADEIEAFPIGKDCEFARTKVDENKELWVSGKSVALGYWNRLKLTAERFVQDESGRKWFKTGDVVHLDEAGNYVFEGRKDRMVKRRGFRIELDEIEQAFQKHEALAQAAVVAISSDNSLTIKLFYLPKEQEIAPTEMDLRMYCRQVLPPYMMPDVFVMMEEFPKTSTHKVNYQALMRL